MVSIASLSTQELVELLSERLGTAEKKGPSDIAAEPQKALPAATEQLHPVSVDGGGGEGQDAAVEAQGVASVDPGSVVAVTVPAAGALPTDQGGGGVRRRLGSCPNVAYGDHAYCEVNKDN